MAEEHFHPIKLASAGDDVKIWDASNYQCAHQFSTHLATSFHSVHWSSDWQQLVSVPTSGSSLLLTLVKQQSVQHLEVDTKIPNTVAKFSSTSSRFLGIGSKCGDIVIWDIKHSKPKKTLKSSSEEVTCLQFNWNDSYVASGFVDGNIILHNATTGQSMSPLCTPNSQAIRDLHYSYIKRSLIGSASDDGTIALWDGNTRQACHHFCGVHSAPATSLAFSPVNFLLLASVGLDKRIICYDTQVKRLVKSFSCEAPLTSVDLKEDGITLAAGSSRGAIYIFDLRSHSVPVHTISAHSSSVQSLSFQNASFGSLLKKDPPKSSNKYDLDVVSQPFNAQKNVMEGASVNMKNEPSVPLHVQRALQSHFQEMQRGSLTAEIFSPLKGTLEKSSEVLLKGADSSVESQPVPFTDVAEHTAPQVSDAFHPEIKRDSLTDEIFSPVRDHLGFPAKTPAKTVSYLAGIRQTPAASVSQSVFLPDVCLSKSQNSVGEKFSPLLSEDKNIFPNLRRQQPLGAGENILFPPVLSTKSTLSDLPKTEINQFPVSSASTEIPNQMGLFVQFETDSLRSMDESNDPITSVMGTDGDRSFQSNEINDLEASKPFETISEAPEIMEFDTAANASDSRNVTSEKSPNSPNKDGVTEPMVDEGKGSSEPATPMAPQAFQAEFIRQIVDDAMEECRQEIRQSFLHYYIQMVRQFERQKGEMEALLQRYSINVELVSEIKRLREENNHLRATF